MLVDLCNGIKWWLLFWKKNWGIDGMGQTPFLSSNNSVTALKKRE